MSTKLNSYLDQCIRKLCKNFGNSDDKIIIHHNGESYGDGDECDDRLDVVLKQDQYSHFFPDGRLQYQCTLCPNNFEITTNGHRMMVLSCSPAPIFPVCSSCSETLLKK
jgi:hypothetical protein